ncbi:MAG TPA: MaoC family dehydratase N-terminal domain-containing protein [Sporichthya sp.]|nr:MaoC family dehydratase N-terminal domain-containing protein [Sporichthya sp.]
MPISQDAVGMKLPPVSMDIERGRLTQFARATGATDPVYSNLDAARDAGHPDIPAPPTFLFSIELEHPDPFQQEGWCAGVRPEEARGHRRGRRHGHPHRRRRRRPLT